MLPAEAATFDFALAGLARFCFCAAYRCVRGAQLIVRRVFISRKSWFGGVGSCRLSVSLDRGPDYVKRFSCAGVASGGEADSPAEHCEHDEDDSNLAGVGRTSGAINAR